MPTYTQQQIQERYDSLPENLKSAIFSVETADIIQKVSKKYNLQIDQMGELASETGLVMLGFTHPKDYIKNLSARLGIDIDSAKKIAQEINIEIFSPVKEALKKLHGMETEKEPTIPTAPTATKIKPEKELTVPVAPVAPTEKIAAPEIKPENKIPEITEKEIPKPTTPVELTQKHKPEEKMMFPEKIQEQSFREPSQTTEIKYPNEDPYREPLEK